jgi:hypothetical protein
VRRAQRRRKQVSDIQHGHKSDFTTLSFKLTRGFERDHSGSTPTDQRVGSLRLKGAQSAGALRRELVDGT